MGPCGRFADLLEYPGAELPARLRACRELPLGAEAAEALQRFQEVAEGSCPARLEEEYAAAFDLDGSCALYAGHHLFGEDARRNRLLCGLAAQYRRDDFPSPAGELPDYLPVLLRYLEAGGSALECPVPDEVRRELLADVVLPAARKLEAALAGRAHPYAPLLRALVLTLEAATVPGGRPEACAEGATA